MSSGKNTKKQVKNVLTLQEDRSRVEQEFNIEKFRLGRKLLSSFKIQGGDLRVKISSCLIF